MWEKEGLLEYQEERLVNTEDLETEMAAYINEMASQATEKGQGPARGSGGPALLRRREEGGGGAAAV